MGELYSKTGMPIPGIMPLFQELNSTSISFLFIEAERKSTFFAISRRGLNLSFPQTQILVVAWLLETRGSSKIKHNLAA